MQGIGEVAAIPRCLPPDVSQQPPKKPGVVEGDVRAPPAASHHPLREVQGRGWSLSRETPAQGGWTWWSHGLGKASTLP